MLIHGIVLKLLSIASKLGFLLLIVPLLKAGVFTEYVISLTYAVLIARVLSFGLEEQLVTEIRGDAEKLAVFLPIYALSLVLVIFAVISSFIYDEGNFIYLISVVLMSGSILGGLIRSIYPGQYEWIMNIPWIIFFCVVFFMDVISVHQLLIMLSMSHLLVHAVIVFGNKKLFSIAFCNLSILGVHIKRIIKSSILKVVASLLLIADFRGIILFSRALYDNVLIDSITMALSIGEGIWQLFMVVVNRKYNEYCVKKTKYISVFIVSLKVFLGMLVSAGVVNLFDIFFKNYFIELDVLDFNKITWGIVFFASMAALINIRNYFWAERIYEKRILLVQVFILLVEFFVVGVASEENWLMLTSLVLGFIAIVLSLSLFRVINSKTNNMVL